MELDIKFLMITWSFIGVNNFFEKTTSKQEGTCGIPKKGKINSIGPCISWNLD